MSATMTKYHSCQHNNYQITVNTNVTRSPDLTFTRGQIVDGLQPFNFKIWAGSL